MSRVATVVAGASSSLTDPPPSELERFLEDNGLLVGSVAFVLVMAFGIAWVAAAHHRTARRRAMEPTAREHGLGYAASDPFGCTTVAFPLFRAGDGREVEHVMWRDGANGQPVRVFDYSYYDEWTDEYDRAHRRYRHFTCAMARHNGLWPQIRILRERMVDRLAQKLGLPDIELESEAFNRTFVVQCEDRRFATDLLAPEMMDLLLHTAGLVDVETKGRWLLVTADRAPAADFPGLLGFADELVRRIPPVVWDLYPKAPDAPGGAGDERDEHDAAAAEGVGGVLGSLDPTVAHALRAEQAEDREREPRVEYDLDGRPVTEVEENPWG